MGWGQEAAERIKQQRDEQLVAQRQALEATWKIANSAEDLWREISEQIEADVAEFSGSSHQDPGLRCLRLNANNLTVERNVQPTLKLEVIRYPGSHVLIEFSGITGQLGKCLQAGPQVYRFGLDALGAPAFIRDDGKATSPQGVSREVGLLIEEFCTKYL